MVLVVEIDDLCNHQKEIHSVLVPQHKKEGPHAGGSQLNVRTLSFLQKDVLITIHN